MTDAPEILHGATTGTRALGEVRVTVLDDQKTIIASGHSDDPADTQKWVMAQLAEAGFSELHEAPPDTAWIDALLTEYLVRDERAPITCGFVRGEYQGRHDMIGLIIVADIYPVEGLGYYHFRIATLPIAPWAEREQAFLQGLRSMAVQRYSRELVLAMVAKDVPGYTPVPVPGLRLKKPIEPVSEDGDNLPRVSAEWDLTSERGGLDR